MKEQKFCKDCKWCGKSVRSSICNSPKNRKAVDLVTGEVKYREHSCAIQRIFPWILAVIGRECGTSARWFQPKETIMEN